MFLYITAPVVYPALIVIIGEFVDIRVTSFACAVYFLYLLDGGYIVVGISFDLVKGEKAVVARKVSTCQEVDIALILQTEVDAVLWQLIIFIYSLIDRYRRRCHKIVDTDACIHEVQTINIARTVDSIIEFFAGSLILN